MQSVYILKIITNKDCILHITICTFCILNTKSCAEIITKDSNTNTNLNSKRYNRTYMVVIARPKDFRQISWGKAHTSTKTAQAREEGLPVRAETSTYRCWLSLKTDSLKS